MNQNTNYSGTYQIEVSGWGLDDMFFVENSNLSWSGDEEKRLTLRHAISDGAIIFVRLIAPEPSFTSVPVAYEVHDVQSMNSGGLCEMRLSRLHPQSREQLKTGVASLFRPASSNSCKEEQSQIHAEQEEVLYEA
jgi:hypothetical protein